MTAARIPPTKHTLRVKKTCGKCHKRKVLDDFHTHSGMRDGRQAWCRVCMNKIMRRIGRKKAAELRAYRLLKNMINVAEQEA